MAGCKVDIKEKVVIDTGCPDPADSIMFMTEGGIQMRSWASIKACVSSPFVIHPDYDAPTASLVGSPTPGQHEIGQTIDIILNGAFVQNDGGASSGMSLKKNGTQIATTEPFTDTGVLINATPKVYRIDYAYAQGPILDNNIPEPDPIGRIEAGTALSNTVTYTGAYKIFYAPVIAVPANSADVRSLANNRLTTAGNTFILNTGTTQKKFAIDVPPGKVIISIIDLDNFNLEILGEYVQSSLSVNDAAGTPYTSKLYIKQQLVPYSINTRHQVTLGDE